MKVNCMDSWVFFICICRRCFLSQLFIAGLLATGIAVPAAAKSPTSPMQSLSLASSEQRPLNPWVFRSVLDGQPRMVTVALDNNLFIAYNAERAALYKVWNGKVDFAGAVYNTQHGPQPTTTGYAFYQAPVTHMPWVLAEKGKTYTPKVAFKGYRFEQNRVIFQYDLISNENTVIRISETPEYIARHNQQGLQRLFTMQVASAKSPSGQIRVGLQTALTSLNGEKDLVTDGEFVVAKREVIDQGKGTMLSLEGTLWLKQEGRTRIETYYPPKLADLAEFIPTQAQERLTGNARGKALIAVSDCHACHNEERKTVGPSYREIARRYPPSDDNLVKLATKVIQGGSGSWGEISMNPHPELMPEDARLMVSYILSLSAVTETDKTAAEAQSDLFLGVPSRPLQLDDRPKTHTRGHQAIQSGLAVAAFHIEDFAEQIYSQTVLSGVAPVVHVHRLEDLGAITTNLRLLFTGFLAIDKAGTYRLRLITDDGGRMKINGQPVVDRWQHQGPTPTDVQVTLQEGLNEIEIDYFQALAGGSISLQWIPPGETSFTVIPAKHLRHHQQQLAQPVPYIPRRELVKNIPGDKTPLVGVHPSFTLEAARPSWFEPMVGGLDFFRDGRLALCTWDAQGSVYLLEGVLDRAPEAITVKQIASGLGECLGLKIVDEQIYVMQKHELTHLIDHNDDGAIDEYRTLSDGWRASANFHEFSFGLEYDRGYFYAALATAIDPGGASTQPQIPDRGKAIKVSRQDGSVEFIAHGLRTPNGIGKGVDGEIFITDNQGDWLPSSKLVHLQTGAFYGSRSVDFAGTQDLAEMPPVVWLPQDEIGNSPSQPTRIPLGDYAGQMLHGDVTHGGLKRVYAEKIRGNYQGAVFRFAQGLEAGINRLAWAPDGKTLVVGGIGNPGNWSQQGKKWFGLQKLTFNGQKAFEIKKVSARSNGMELEFTQALEPGRGITAGEYQVKQWYYRPTADYGGDKQDLEDLAIASVNLSQDRKKVFLELANMKAGHLLYLRITDPFLSESGQSLWSTEAWYTLNAIPVNKPGFNRLVNPPPDNTLTPEQRKAGWQLLFDGKSLQGWRNYYSQTPDAAWKVVDGTLHLDTHDQQNRQDKGSDLITVGNFENFELYLEWKLAPGGNSGVIYGVVENPKYEFAWQTGPEYQLLDNPGHPEGAVKTHRAGDLYDLIASRFVAVNAGGEWNRTRLVVNKGQVEHWLNGYKVVEYDQKSPHWRKLIQSSKFRDIPGFGQSRSGHIALQNHGDPVWFRNIRIRKL